jgi:hypothetical protein
MKCLARLKASEFYGIRRRCGYTSKCRKVRNVYHPRCSADRARCSSPFIRCGGSFADGGAACLRETRQRRGDRTRHSRRRARRGRYRFWNRARILRSAAGVLLSVRGAGLLCRSRTGLLLRAAARRVLCARPILWPPILPRWLLNKAPVGGRRVGNALLTLVLRCHRAAQPRIENIADAVA